MSNYQLKEKKKVFLISILCLLGLTIWLFPKSLYSVNFLGVSDPLFIYEKRGSKKEKIRKLRKPASESKKIPVYSN